MKRRAPLVVVVLLAACVSTGYDRPIARPALDLATTGDPQAHVTVREDRHEVEVVVGPFDVASRTRSMDAEAHGGHHGHSDMYSPMVVFPWPVESGLKGFRLAAYSADGTEYPREIFHHVIGVNFDRRQLVYPVAERLFGFGTETPDIRLPGSLAVPIERGDSIGLYAMWNNETGETLEDVYMHVVLPYAPPGEEAEHALPIYMDTNHHVDEPTSFDLPPGRSVHAYEFELPVGGGLLAASGHLHDYGTELRLEEVESGRVLVELEAETDGRGRVERVEQRIFRRFFNLLDDRVPLEAGVRYRVVGVYENPTGRVIPDGGMAHIVGMFVPDDLDAWPELDRSGDLYTLDRRSLPAPLEGHAHEGH